MSAFPRSGHTGVPGFLSSVKRFFFNQKNKKLGSTMIKNYLVEELFASGVRLDGKLQLCVHRRHTHIYLNNISIYTVSFKTVLGHQFGVTSSWFYMIHFLNKSCYFLLIYYRSYLIFSSLCTGANRSRIGWDSRMTIGITFWGISYLVNVVAHFFTNFY